MGLIEEIQLNNLETHRSFSGVFSLNIVVQRDQNLKIKNYLIMANNCKQSFGVLPIS